MAAKLHITEKQTGYGFWGGAWQFPDRVYEGSTIWFSVHTFFPKDFEHYSFGQGGRLKFLRIKTKDGQGRHVGYNDLYINTKGSQVPFRFIYEGEQVWSNVGSSSEQIKKDTWENYQMAITLGSKSKNKGGMAEVFIWKNGRLLLHETNRITLSDPNGFADSALLFTYWNGGAPATQQMFVDEITITTAKPSETDNEGNPMLPFYLLSNSGEINSNH